MKRTIELTRIAVDGDTVKYEIHDNTGFGLLRKEKVEAQIQFHNADAFGFEPDKLPESVLALPITLYLLPVTFFYHIELILSSIDNTLYHNIPTLYAAYSQMYGPFKEEWRGKIVAKEIVANQMPDARYDRIVFFSGGVDAIHAGINNPGKRNVLVSVPSIEVHSRNEGALRNEKFVMIKEFSRVIGSDWLLVANDFNQVVFDDEIGRNGKITRYLRNTLQLNTVAFNHSGFWGMRYIPNLCSVAPFAYAMGIKELIMGSSLIEDKLEPALDGTNPLLTNGFKFVGISFAEQDGLYTRRSQKVKNIVSTFKNQGKHVRIWACFVDNSEQCGECAKCVRTQLNILCTGENPKDWGFARFDEKKFSQLVRSYCWFENSIDDVWGIIDSIDDSRTYPYSNELLHWLKRVGYKRYFNRSRWMRKLMLNIIFKFSKYPHYICVAWHKMIGR